MKKKIDKIKRKKKQERRKALVHKRNKKR